MVFLVSEGSFLAKNITAFFIVDISIEGYMLIASTDAIVTFSLFSYNSSSISFRSDAWRVESREYFTFALSNILLSQDIRSWENVAVKFVAGITNLIENNSFPFIVLW